MQKIIPWSEYKARREKLLQLVKGQYPKIKEGFILLFGALEQGTIKFKQESSFYYYTGIQEPGSVLLLNLDGSSVLYVPNCGTVRAQWVDSAIMPNSDKTSVMGFDVINYLGEQVKGYEFYPFFSKEEYGNLLSKIDQTIKNNGTIFTLNPNNQYQYFEARFILQRINYFLPTLFDSIADISSIIAKMRREKSKKEIECLYKAVDITIMGHEAVTQIISPDKFENEIQAGIEYVFTASGASLAFPSIVGSGKNSTTLHYNSNNQLINKGDLVVVDIGAEYEHYCGDLTRTYPASGKFNKRQREIYDIVLATQEYIETIARPGLWLSNKDKPDSSLNHLAREFLKEKGYEKYFFHGIGHFVGLDVHDVGDSSEPLQIGDIITIEPGIYIADEQIGVRIEDNYWVVEDGLVCLSEHLPKDAGEIEKLLAK